MKLKRMEITLIITLIFCMLFHFFSFAAECGSVKKDVLRLHILANSDSAADQALKLKVRNALLLAGGDTFEGTQTVELAKQKALKNLDKMEKIATDTLRKNGCMDCVHVSLEKTYFDTRYYTDFTLPAGEYEALKVVIGKGGGHNWWCVMFPALCLAASDNSEALQALTPREQELIQSNPKTEIRFKCVEIYEKIKKML
ncbi:MAG: stage II sporulation protein R [Clostridia bacterium]|nr:stage II sporulation protein R [Clostridia bacterium]